MNERLTTTAGAPVADNQNSLTAGPRGPGAAAGLSAAREACAPESRAHSRTRGSCQRLGRFRHADRDQRHHADTPGRSSSAPVGKKTDLLIRFSTVAGEQRRRRCRTRRARLRHEVLHRGGQLGPGRQQHAGVLHPRSAQISRTSSIRRSATRRPTCAAPTAMWDFWSLSPGEPASGYHSDVGPRPAAELRVS